MSESFNEIQSVTTVSEISTHPKRKFRSTLSGIILSISIIASAVVVPTSIILIRTAQQDTTATARTTKRTSTLMPLKINIDDQTKILNESILMSKLMEKPMISNAKFVTESQHVQTTIDPCDRTYIDLYRFQPNAEIHSMITTDLDSVSHLPGLIVAFTNPGKIEIFALENQSLRLTQVIQSNAFQPTVMSIADMNQDDEYDLFVFNALSNELIVFLHQQNHTFIKHSVYPMAGEIYSMSTADLNNDRIPEMIILLNNSPAMLVFSNQDVHQQKSYHIGCQGQSLTVNDINSDGYLDVIVTCTTDQQIIIMYNTGNGTLIITSIINTLSQPISTVFADLDQDNTIDMVTINKNTNSIEIFINQNQNEWHKSQIYRTDFELCRILLGHINADQKVDIIVSFCQEKALGFLHNIDGEHFTNPILYGTQSHSIGIDQMNSDETNVPLYVVQQTGVGIVQSVCH